MHNTTRTTGAVPYGLRDLILASIALAAAACSGGSGPAAVTTQPATAPRIESTATSGAADALAAELLIAAGRAASSPLQPSGTVADAGLADAIAGIAFDHLQSGCYGAGAGPSMLGSRRIQRLALAPTAPADNNGDGSNLDETLTQDLARLAATAGATVPAGLDQIIAPWSEASAELAARQPAGPSGPADWRTAAGPSRVIRVRDIAAAMLGRLRAAGNLLAQQRGTLFGATPENGLLGLVQVAQCVAAEEELVSTLSTDGDLLGAFEDPHAYDPASERRWFATEVAVPPGDDRSLAFTARDLASDLATQSLILDAAAELSWFASTTNPSASVRAVFTGPFAPPPVQNPPTPRLNYQNDIRPVLSQNCSGCHFGFPTGGFRCDTYALLRAGSPHSNGLGYTMVIPGDHANSLLHRILTTPPAGITRMPAGSSISATNLQRIDTWIDQGALELPEVIPPPPTPGQDLAALSFRNLVALHFDATTGALHHRLEGDRRSGIATAEATGRTLSALAHLRAVAPTTTYGTLGVTAVLQLAATFASQHFVDAAGRVVADVDLTTLASGRAAALADQAVLTLGLLDAARSLASPSLQSVATLAAQQLLTAFRDDADGWFRAEPGHRFARYAPQELADLLAALRLAAAAGIDGAADARQALLARLLPTLAYASFAGLGGLPLPAAAGGEFGRLPVLAGAILVGPAGDAPAASGEITWTQHVRPLLLGKCADCHFGGANQGGYRLDTMALAATSGGQNGATTPLVPGDPEGSFLYRKLIDRQPASGAQMPLQRALLDDRARALVRRWIETGASAR